MNKGRFPNFWSVVFRCFYNARNPCLVPSKIYRIPFPHQFVKPLYAVVPIILALKLGSETKNDEKGVKNIIDEADKLYKDAQFDKLYELLNENGGMDNPEILWRLARATFEKSKMQAADSKKLELLEQALVDVNKALEISDNCWAAHKWKAILLDYVWRYKSTKGRLEHSFEVKKHMEKAIELNPKDGTSHYLLGEWCYTFADLPWYQRKVASVIFTSPPTSSFEEAYASFKTAEEVEPGFYGMNLLMLAKCLMKLNKKDEAIDYLKQARDYPAKTSDDKKAQEEALELLRKLGVA